MKTLILVRHAKSDKSDPALNDFDRSLNRRGSRDALAMAERFMDLGLRIDALISSPAVRAFSTAEAFAQKLFLPIQAEQRIYEAGVSELLAVVRGLDDPLSTVMLVGHNPGLSEFLRYLTDENFSDLPTTSIVVVDIPVKAWRHTFSGRGVLKSRLSPGNESIGVQRAGPALPWTGRFRLWRFENALRFEIILVLAGVILLLMLLIPLIMHHSVDNSAMPQQGSSR